MSEHSRTLSKNEASLITLFADFLVCMQNTETPRSYLLSHSKFILNVNAQHSAVRGVMTYVTSPLSDTHYPHWYVQLYMSCRLSLILHQTSHGHSHGAQAREDTWTPPEKPALSNASLRAAFVHTIGDLLQGISVLISALIICFKVSSLAFLAIKDNSYFHRTVSRYNVNIFSVLMIYIVI